MSENKFACYCKKIVTVSEKGTIRDGVIIVNDGKIEDIGTYIQLKDKLNETSILFDIKGLFNKNEIEKEKIEYWSL